jgi:hypothetical protein
VLLPAGVAEAVSSPDASWTMTRDWAGQWPVRRVSFVRGPLD